MKFHALSELEARTKPEILAKARRLCKQDMLNLKLREMREKYGVKQGELSNFTQTAVSKLEGRKDIKVSTLIDYVESLGMGLEITALPRGEHTDREVLLRV
jgi:hypothetical protein